MFRVTLPVLAAAVATLVSAGSANAQCCNSGGLFTSGWSGGGCCNSGYSVSVAPLVVQAAPIVVQQPVVIQQQPVVQQYVVNQGPVYSGPGTIGTGAYYYPPRAVGAYPYVGGHRWGGHYRRAAWGGPRYGHHHYHGPIRRYY